MALSQTLQSFLVDHRANYELEHHALSLSSLCTARAADVDEGCLAKSVLLEDDDGPVLAVLPAARRLELGNLRAQLGRNLRFATEDQSEHLFPDCVLGAMPPLGMAFGLPTVLDRSLESLPEIYFEAGDHETLVRMRGDAFMDLMEGAARGEIASESPAWVTARRSRERLYGSILAMSEAIAAPIGSGERWQRRLRRELEGVRRALADHIAQSEAPEGLLRQIEGQAPHLARFVEHLRSDHVDLEVACRDMLARMDDCDSSPSLRRRALSLIGEFATHRHRGADLVYEAYGVDIGGG
jgi:Ala-tRNA(Pro) deacylase